MHPVRGTLLLVLAYLLWRHWRKRRRKKVYEFKFSPEREAIIDEYNSLQQSLCKRFKLESHLDMTPSQFKELVSVNIPGLEESVNKFVKEYIRLRYGHDQPSQEEIDNIKDCGRQIISESKGLKKRTVPFDAVKEDK